MKLGVLWKHYLKAQVVVLIPAKVDVKKKSIAWAKKEWYRKKNHRNVYVPKNSLKIYEANIDKVGR